MSNMKDLLAASAVTLTLTLAPALASALTLTNKDKQEHTVGIDTGAKETTLRSRPASPSRSTAATPAAASPAPGTTP